MPRTFASRSARSILPLTVVPSIKISAFPRPSSLHLNEFVVGIEAENMLTDYEIIVTRISSCSVAWQVEPIAIEEYALVAYTCLRAVRGISLFVEHF